MIERHQSCVRPIVHQFNNQNEGSCPGSPNTRCSTKGGAVTKELEDCSACSAWAFYWDRWNGRLGLRGNYWREGMLLCSALDSPAYTKEMVCAYRTSVAKLCFESIVRLTPFDESRNTTWLSAGAAGGTDSEQVFQGSESCGSATRLAASKQRRLFANAPSATAAASAEKSLHDLAAAEKVQLVHEHEGERGNTRPTSVSLSLSLSLSVALRPSFTQITLCFPFSQLPLLCVLVLFVALHLAALLQPMRATGRHCHSATAVLLSALCFVVALALCDTVPSDQRTQFGKLRSSIGKRCAALLCTLARY